MKLKLSRRVDGGYVSVEGGQLQKGRDSKLLLYMYLCGLMRIRSAGWLLDSTVIENWLSLIWLFFFFGFSTAILSRLPFTFLLFSIAPIDIQLL